MSFFESAPLFSKDAIFALTAQYNNDASPVKVNLGQGSYRDENGLPWVLPSVREARRRVSSRKLDHEYLPILGLQNFRSAVGELVLGSEAYAAIGNRLATAQSLSGTGSLHLAGALIRNYSGLNRQVWVSEPTWSNHHLVFSSLGFEVQTYRYYDPGSRSLDWSSYMDALRTAERRSIIVLHACAHNPTGCDPTKDQWREIGRIMKERELFPLFDAAYLGFRSGNFDDDAFSIRYLVNELGLECAVAISFAKSMGLYGERVGATIIVTKSDKVARNCESVLERLQRSEISNPPAYGCKIATQILLDESLKRMWFEDLKTMSSRIELMRERLCQLLVKNGALGTWDHIRQQSGMFGFLGLSEEVVLKLREQYHIYMADNSRISIAGLNESNVAYVAKAITHSLGAEQNALAASSHASSL
ncbi:Aspartate aminotransferase, mitochondrial [Exophiala dermatitidis]